MGKSNKKVPKIVIIIVGVLGVCKALSLLLTFQTELIGSIPLIGPSLKFFINLVFFPITMIGKLFIPAVVILVLWLLISTILKHMKKKSAKVQAVTQTVETPVVKQEVSDIPRAKKIESFK